MIIPYGRQTIDETDIAAVVDALKSDLLTTGPRVHEFEKAISKTTGAKYAVAVSSGTAALHLACLAAGLREGDEIITSPMTFAASANCALYCNAQPIFADIDAQGLIDPEQIKAVISDRTKIIIPVHYSGLSCDMKRIKALADQHNLVVIEDACHALGSRYENTTIGDCTYSDMTCFSTHPVKHITTGEGGVITTNDKNIYEKLCVLRNHGIVKDNLERKGQEAWYYEIQALGYNYRITDIQCALGTSQISRLKAFIEKRRSIAKKYEEAFEKIKKIDYIQEKPGQYNAYHLFVLLTENEKTRKELYNHLREKGIHTQIHYIPIHWHPLYQRLGYQQGAYPKSEEFYKRIISIPIYPTLTEEQQEKVIKEIKSFYAERKER